MGPLIPDDAELHRCSAHACLANEPLQKFSARVFDDGDVDYYVGKRLKLEGETENNGGCESTSQRIVDKTGMWAVW